MYREGNQKTLQVSIIPFLVLPLFYVDHYKAISISIILYI